jgi:hypothetical protein
VGIVSIEFFIGKALHESRNNPMNTAIIFFISPSIIDISAYRSAVELVLAEHHHSVCSLSGDVCACPAFFAGERGPTPAKACPRALPSRRAQVRFCFWNLRGFEARVFLAGMRRFGLIFDPARLRSGGRLQPLVGRFYSCRNMYIPSSAPA